MDDYLAAFCFNYNVLYLLLKLLFEKLQTLDKLFYTTYDNIVDLLLSGTNIQEYQEKIDELFGNKGKFLLSLPDLIKSIVELIKIYNDSYTNNTSTFV